MAAPGDILAGWLEEEVCQAVLAPCFSSAGATAKMPVATAKGAAAMAR